MKKILSSILVLGFIAFGTFLYLEKENKEKIEDFVATYENLDKSLAEYYAVILFANLKENPDINKATKKFSQIIDSIDNDLSDAERQKLAIETIKINNDIIKYLSDNYGQKEKTTNALLTLNRKATTIKNKEIQNKAIEITDIFTTEIKNIGDLEKATITKREMSNNLLRGIVDDNGKLNGFLSYLKNNQEKMTDSTYNIDNYLEKITKISTERHTTYARFKGLSSFLN